MSWDRGELRADPGIAPGDRNVGAPKRRRSVWPSIAVVTAAAAFGGVIWFAYQNARMSNQPSVPPLVKADPGPVRIKPDQPGGQEIPFQDSTVYDRLSQKGQKPQMEKLLPPPEEPVARPQPVVPPPDDGSPTVLAPAPGAILTPPVVAAPRPAPPQPAPKLPADALAAIAATDPLATKPAAANPIAGGVYRIQLGSVRTTEEVASEWSRLRHRFPDTLSPLKLTSGKAAVPGKGMFYRIQAGPLDQAGARSACAAMRAKGIGCVVVKP